MERGLLKRRGAVKEARAVKKAGGCLRGRAVFNNKLYGGSGLLKIVNI